jgi:hypothetical protein
VAESFAAVAALVSRLRLAGFEPVLIGGHALEHFGSDRITKDFDFVVSRRDDLVPLIDALYDSGFCLITKLTPEGVPRRFIEEVAIARLRVREDCPDALFFVDPETRIKVDVLLDFPVPAKELRDRAVLAAENGVEVNVASREDLKRMKALALADRGASRDIQDYLFLGGTEEEVERIRGRK